MSQNITITSVTANTPANIYYCDSMSASCVFVSAVTEFPYSFTVPAPYDETDFLIKIVDVSGCTIGEFVYVTPTPTSSLTPTPTPTVTQTQTPTQTITQTPSETVTNTPTPTETPTNTPTPTTTPVVSIHQMGKRIFSTSGYTCYDTMSETYYYCYINEANTTPVLGAVIYTLNISGVLYNRYDGGNRFIKMKWGGNFYEVQINPIGEILSFNIC